MLSFFPRDPTPRLRSERLTLRGARMRDHSAWAALRRRNRPYLQPFEPRWSEADLAARVFAIRIRRGREEARKGTDFSFLAICSAPFMGEKCITICRPIAKGCFTCRRIFQFKTIKVWGIFVVCD